MSAVVEFFRGEEILITGGTGFVGKLLISKLLLSCPRIKKILLLVRKKENVSTNTRLKELFNNAIFEKLKLEFPKFYKKIELIEGNCEQEQLGLTPTDRYLISQNITIIFHCAANVKFDNDLKTELNINVFGAIEIMKVAKLVRNLKAFVYVSSSYSNCHFSVVEEKCYEPSVHYRTLLKLIENGASNISERQILGDVASTYFYSKAVAEQAIVEEGKGLPIAIFRPSAIISTWQEPVPGWTDKAFAPTAMVKSLILGYFSSILCTSEVIIDMVPADFAVNALIAVAWDTRNRFINGTLVEPRIYNYVSMMDNPLTFKTFLTVIFDLVYQKPSTKAVWYPALHFYENRTRNTICSFMRFNLLVLCLRWCNAISQNGNDEARFDRIKKTYDVLINLMESIIRKPHVFVTDHICELWNDMNEIDQKIFTFDLKTLNWREYINVYYDGILHFILKETNVGTENAQKYLFKLWIHHCIVNGLLIALGFVFLCKLFSSCFL